MKKITALILISVMLGILSGCCLQHDWQEATCTAAKTCAKCGKTEGEPLPDHGWVDANCETPRTCSLCGKTEGNPLGHDWAEATCAAPSTCSRCSQTQGQALDHSFGPWEIQGENMARSCQICGSEERRQTDLLEYQRSRLTGYWPVEVHYSVTGSMLLRDQAFGYWKFPPYIKFLDQERVQVFGLIGRQQILEGTYDLEEHTDKEGNPALVLRIKLDYDGQTVAMGLGFVDYEKPLPDDGNNNIFGYTNEDPEYMLPDISRQGQRLLLPITTSFGTAMYVFHTDQEEAEKIQGREKMLGSWTLHPDKEGQNGIWDRVTFFSDGSLAFGEETEGTGHWRFSQKHETNLGYKYYYEVMLPGNDLIAVSIHEEEDQLPYLMIRYQSRDASEEETIISYFLREEPDA